MPKVTFVNESRVIEAEAGASIRDVALECGISVNNSEDFHGLNCGGHGLCTTCLCWVEESEPGAAGPRSFMERLRALRGWRRLSCRTSLRGDVRVYTMPGQHERSRKQRPVSPPPRPTVDGSPRKPVDAAPTAAFLFGHPSMVASGSRKPPEKAAAKPEAEGEEAGDEGA